MSLGAIGGLLGSAGTAGLAGVQQAASSLKDFAGSTTPLEGQQGGLAGFMKQHEAQGDPWDMGMSSAPGISANNSEQMKQAFRQVLQSELSKLQGR